MSDDFHQKAALQAFHELPLSMRMLAAADVLVAATEKGLVADSGYTEPDQRGWSAVLLRKTAGELGRQEAHDRRIADLANLIFADLEGDLDEGPSRPDCFNLARKLIDLGWEQH